MASNTNCRTCAPVSPVCVTPPPVCGGCECEETYSGACVQYTGTDLDCLGITRGMSLNEMIQILADKLCVEGCCVNPVKWLIDKAVEIYEIDYAAGRYSAAEPISISSVLEKFLTAGIVTPKCNFCCPDCGVYALATPADVALLVAATGASCCTNCGQTYTETYTRLIKENPCLETLYESFEPVEYGTIGGNTVLDVIEQSLAGYDSSVICDVFETIFEQGLVVSCNNPHGAIIISSTATFLTYITNMNLNNICEKGE